MLAWESTTPLGVPSEPEVNKTTAGLSGLNCLCLYQNTSSSAFYQCGKFVQRGNVVGQIFQIHQLTLSA